MVKNAWMDQKKGFFTTVRILPDIQTGLLLWKSCESSVQLFECQRGPNLVHAVLSVRNGSESSFSIVQVFYVRLSLTRDLESCFYYCEGPVKVVQSIFGVSHHCLVMVLWTSGSQVWVSGNMLKVVFTTVLILWSLFTAVWVSGCTDEAFLYKSFIGPPRWWEMLSDSPLILKLACTSFTGLLVVKTAFKIYRNPQTGVHELHSTSTVRMFLCQEVGFTTVEVMWHLVSISFLTRKLAFMSSTELLQS